MKRMEQITPPPNSTSQVVNMAAYARISTKTERTPLSLSAQVSHYQQLICGALGWRFAGVFADSGISGTTTSRPQFQELLALVQAGKIDLILTKSISSFARNTVDLLATVRELKDPGVEVRFEKERISSTSADGELMRACWAEARRLGLDNPRQAPTPPEALAKYGAVAAAEAERLRVERGER